MPLDPNFLSRLKNELGDFLEAKQIERGLTDEQMASLLGVNRQSYIAVKHKKTAKSGFPNLVAALKGLHVIFEHDGLVFGPRDLIRPTIDNPLKGAERIVIEWDGSNVRLSEDK